MCLVSLLVPQIWSGELFLSRLRTSLVMPMLHGNGGQFLWPQSLGSWQAGLRFAVGSGPEKQRIRRRIDAVSGSLFAAGAHLCSLSERAPAFSPWESTVQSGMAFSERDCRLRTCCPAESQDIANFQDAAAAGRAARDSAPRRAGPCQHRRLQTYSIQWNLSDSQQDSFQSDRRNNEYDADAVPFHPRFLLQELIFAHCPCQPRSSFRVKFPSRADGLSLRGIAGTTATFCRSGFFWQLLSARRWQTELFSRAPSGAPPALRERVAINCPLQKHRHPSALDSSHSTLRATQRVCLELGDLRPQHFGSETSRRSHARRGRVAGGFVHCLSKPPSGHRP